jgi:threonine synthase
MKYVSTRGAPGVTLSEAIEQGLAPDGGLYVPERVPSYSPRDFDGAHTLAAVARRVLKPFATEDALEGHLDAICAGAFSIPAPVVPLTGTPAEVLELFHGPTCAFKDFAARFLAACLERLHAAGRKLTVLVATSGDTGAAVAAAFHRAASSWADVVLLYPRGLVSPRQAQQLACWGDNVRTFAVTGTFDDCQRMVKEAFADPALSSSFALSSANSINIGRLLPQMAYYADASLRMWRSDGGAPGFIIPTGNLGNAAACVLAREAGLPIGDIVLVTNANRAIPDFLSEGAWRPRASLPTLASAMDVGNPSNMDRLRWWFSDVDALRRRVTAWSVSDDEIRDTIRRDARAFGRVWDPHTATAATVFRHLAAESPSKRWVIVATAHPAKFPEIVEPLVGREVPVPPALAALLSLPRHEQVIAPTLDALREALL